MPSFYNGAVDFTLNNHYLKYDFAFPFEKINFSLILEENLIYFESIILEFIILILLPIQLPTLITPKIIWRST
jgi:hypothetical protein